MLRKAVLVSCALFLCINLSISSEQSAEEKPKDISQELITATTIRNIGVASSFLGLSFFLLAGLSYFIYSSFEPEKASNDVYSILVLSPIADVFKGMIVPAIIVGSVCLVFGPIFWIAGAHAIRNIEKSKISLQIRGPDLAQGKNLGEISLVWSY